MDPIEVQCEMQLPHSTHQWATASLGAFLREPDAKTTLWICPGILPGTGWMAPPELKPGMTPQEYIVSKLLPEIATMLLEKARDYDAGSTYNHRVLGLPGQFADIWRKVAKLKKGMWEGQDLAGEPLRVVLQDMIGHCLLAIELIDSGNGDMRGKVGAEEGTADGFQRRGHNSAQGNCSDTR
jgi:hypothetical protein